MNNQLKLFLELSKLKGEFSRTYIARRMKFHRQTNYHLFNEFIKNKIVIKTRIVNGTQLFKFNDEVFKIKC